jgi:hypothetical protein
LSAPPPLNSELTWRTRNGFAGAFISTARDVWPPLGSSWPIAFSPLPRGCATPTASHI